MQVKDPKKFILSIAVCQLAGVIGSIFTAPAISGWYRTIQKPWFTPPGWVIGAVWVILFALMGIALYLVWLEGAEKAAVKKALRIFGIQLVLNILWSYLFFGLHSPLLAFIEIIFLWAAIFATIRQFSEVSIKAAYLLIPYVAWVSFAAFLNFMVWRLNV